jgi:sec-independent protein translocase protein TatB
MWDTLILMALALVVFGPRRLPKIGRQLGKLMYEFRKASNDFKFQMEEELRASEEADRRKKEEEARQRALAAAPPPAQPEPPASQTPPPYPEPQQPSAPVIAESPYSEGVGPKIEADAQQVAEPTSIAEPATPSQETNSAQPVEPRAPQIQPPSTGETVAAAPPAKIQGSLFPEAERSEPAPNHG